MTEVFDASGAAADELLAREAARVLAVEGDGPTYSMSEVLADVLGEVDRLDGRG